MKETVSTEDDEFESILDILKEWLLKNKHTADVVVDQTAYYEEIIFYNDLLEMINELSRILEETE